jgi:hypothetical protein
MKAFVMPVAALALLWASGTTSATPLVPNSAGPMGLDRLEAATESVHYTRRKARRHAYWPRYNPYYYRRPAVTYGFPIVPYYSPYPYGYVYAPSYYPYYGYPYAYGPSFGFGIHIGR